jgi:branched-chain amino acid transport system permease protein
MKHFFRSRRFAIFLVLLIAAVPIALNDKTVTYFVTLVLLWGIFCLSFDLSFGIGGMMSFGHAALFGAGAYVFAILGGDHSWPFLPTIALAMLIPGVLATSFAAISARASRLYFGLATLAVAEVLYALVTTQLRPITGGADGIVGVPRPVIFGFSLSSERSFYCFVVLVALAFFACMDRLHRSQFGLTLGAIRQNENRMAQMGVNPMRFKIIALAISGAGSGLAGALVSSQMSYAGPQMLGWNTSGDVLMMTVVGGAGTLLGPLVGVFIVELLKAVLSAHTIYWYGILGLLFVLVTIYLPGGVVPFLIRTYRRICQGA